MGIPKVYSPLASGITASFDAVELLEGKVYAVLQAGRFTDAVADGVLTTQSIDSPVNGATQAGAWTADPTGTAGVDFDVLLDKTMTIDTGNIMINATAKTSNPGASNFHAYVYDVNAAAVETLIVSGSMTPTLGVSVESRVGIILPITSKYTIKKGNKLRLNIIQVTAGGNRWIFHQPGTAGTGGILTGTLPATLKMWVPFEAGGIYG